MKKLMLIALLAAAVTGCGGKPPPDPAIALCPARTIAVLQKNQTVLAAVVPGESPASTVKGLRGVARHATLDRGGEAMGVVFFQTGLPKCPWLRGQDALTPVVIKDDVIVAKGHDMLTDLTHKGWVIREATWPWQRYEFGYLPQK